MIIAEIASAYNDFNFSIRSGCFKLPDYASTVC